MSNLKQLILQLANPERAIGTARFFKTGKGQYGESDVFIEVKSQTSKSPNRHHYQICRVFSLGFLHHIGSVIIHRSDTKK